MAIEIASTVQASSSLWGAASTAEQATFTESEPTHEEVVFVEERPEIQEPDNGEFFALTLSDLEPAQQHPENNADIPGALERDLLISEAKVLKNPNAVANNMGISMRNEVKKHAIGVEELKTGQINKLIDAKEEAIREVEKIHEFLTAFKACADEKNTTYNMKEEPFCHQVDEMRALFGDKMFPPGIYVWKTKDQIEGLRESLFNKVQDNMSRVSMRDLEIANLMETLKEIHDILRKIGEGEERSIDKINNHSSRSGG